LLLNSQPLNVGLLDRSWRPIKVVGPAPQERTAYVGQENRSLRVHRDWRVTLTPTGFRVFVVEGELRSASVVAEERCLWIGPDPRHAPTLADLRLAFVAREARTTYVLPPILTRSSVAVDVRTTFVLKENRAC